MEKRMSNPVPNDEYGERHHIVPRSEGGTDDNENLVRLTAREHYIAHLLLAKIYNDFKMYSAVLYMQCRSNSHQRDYKFNSRLYEQMRKKFAIYISENNKGNTAWNKGKKMSEIARQHMREAQLKRPPTSQQTKLKMSTVRKGKKYSTKHKMAISLGRRGYRWITDGVSEKPWHEEHLPVGWRLGRIYSKRKKAGE